MRTEVVVAVSYVPFHPSLISSTSNLDKSLIIYEFLSGKTIEPNTNIDISRIQHFRSGIFPNFDIFRWYFPKIPCFSKIYIYTTFLLKFFLPKAVSAVAKARSAEPARAGFGKKMGELVQGSNPF